MTKLFQMLIRSTVLVGVTSLAAAVQAQDAQVSLIDRQLINGIDLRTSAFEGCLDATSCTVNGLTIEGFQLDAGGNWIPQILYWDPIDGIGVAGSGQNDEIDYDEQLVITTNSPFAIRGVWLSDLFVGEGRHYGAAVEGEDAESGRVTLFGRNNYALGAFEISGDKSLPDINFNSAIDNRLEEGGDLLSRLLVDENLIRVVAAGHEEDVALSIPRGSIDPEKKDIFAGVETVERDDAALLALINGVVLFQAGTHNADALTALANDPSLFDTLYKKAITERAFGNISNGEVSATFVDPVEVTRVTFSAPLGTSNDFSVAGFVMN